MPEPAVPLAPPAPAPGSALTLNTRVPLPEAAGRYELFVEVVEEGVRWFSDRGSPPLALPLGATAA